MATSSISVPATVFLDENSSTAWAKGVIIRDNILHSLLESSVSGWNHPRIYTELPEKMRPTGIVHTINRQLISTLQDSEDQDTKKIMNHLIALRSLVNLYFDTLKVRPPYIKSKPTPIKGIVDMHKKSEEYIQRTTYFLADPTSYGAQQAVTTVSLFLSQLIHFYQLNNGQVYHLPGQVQPIAKHYQKGYYLLDSYYKYNDEEKVVENMQSTLHNE